MRKTIKDLALYLKEIIVQDSQDTETLPPHITEVSNDQMIKSGIDEFRKFLIQMFDMIITEENMCDTYKKEPHIYENRITLSVNFSFLHHVKSVLMNLGIKGEFSKDKSSLTCDSDVFNQSLSITQTINVLSFLIKCGLVFEGINIEDKKHLLDTKVIKVSYPKNSNMLFGLKVMAQAEVSYGSLVNQDVFLRCDYKVLSHEKVDTISIVKQTITPLSVDLQNFVLSLHEHAMKQGYKAIVEIKGFWIYIKYMYKRKEIWGLNTSLNNGLHINIKATQMPMYPKVIETFPESIKEVISKGFGCGRKIKSIGYCNGGCRGMIIPLDHLILDIGNDIIKWFDTEITYH